MTDRDKSDSNPTVSMNTYTLCYGAGREGDDAGCLQRATAMCDAVIENTLSG